MDVFVNAHMYISVRNTPKRNRKEGKTYNEEGRVVGDGGWWRVVGSDGWRMVVGSGWVVDGRWWLMGGGW